MEEKKNINDVNKQAPDIHGQPNNNDRYKITVCGGDGCTSFGGESVRAKIENEIKVNCYEDKIELNKSECRSLCFSGPIIVAGPRNKIYKDVNVENVAAIIQEAINAQTI